MIKAEVAKLVKRLKILQMHSRLIVQAQYMPSAHRWLQSNRFTVVDHHDEGADARWRKKLS
jgi:hypothetical protein